MISIGQPILFVGESGSSKTVTIRSSLDRVDSRFKHFFFNFSSRTKSFDVQRSIEAQLEKRSKDTYGPSAGNQLLIFIDDLSMPKIDSYGTQSALAFLKLLIEKRGMYERQGELRWKSIVDIGWIAAATCSSK